VGFSARIHPLLRVLGECLPPAGVIRHRIVRSSGEAHQSSVKESRSGSDECTYMCAHCKARENESSLIINNSFYVIAHRGCSQYNERIFFSFDAANKSS